jgi:hypothetical protein
MRKALTATIVAAALLAGLPAAATTKTVWQHNGLRVTYTHDRFINGVFDFENTTSHALRFACSLDTGKGIDEAGRKLRAHRHSYASLGYGESIGGSFTWIGCRESRAFWPRLPIQLAHEYWRSGRLEVLYYRSHVYFFNRVHYWVSYRSCSWTTNDGAKVRSYPNSFPLHPYHPFAFTAHSRTSEA